MATANTTLTGPDDAETPTTIFDLGIPSLAVPARINSGGSGWTAINAWVNASPAGTSVSPTDTAYGRHSRMRITGVAGTNAQAICQMDAGMGTSLFFGVGETQAVIVGTMADTITTGGFWLGYGTPGNGGSDNTPIKTASGDDFIGERIVLGANPGDTQLRVGWGKPATAGMTAVTLNGGSGFPVSNATDMYLFYVHYYPSTAAGGRRFEWVAKNLTTGLAVTGTATTNLPPGANVVRACCIRTSGVDAVNAPALECAGYATGAFARGYFF